MDETSDEPECCPICGAQLEWVDCWMGCDEGYFDEYETDPINNDPGDMSPCSACHGEGGYLECPDAEHHAAILAEQGQSS